MATQIKPLFKNEKLKIPPKSHHTVCAVKSFFNSIPGWSRIDWK